MERLLGGLQRRDAYPHDVDRVRVMQTHISAVFLAGPYAYKVKKPVTFGFVDFGTLERRRRFCHEEVRLNRRLAPAVYQGVVPIVAGPDGPRILDVLLEDPSDAVPDDRGGDVVEWAVRMVRLPEERSLKSLLERDDFGRGGAPGFLRRLAGLLAEFHARAERGEEIARVGDFPSVAANARENFDELAAAAGSTVSAAVLQRLREHSERTLARLKPLIEERARRQVPCDTHGDLRLGHVYHLRDTDTPSAGASGAGGGARGDGPGDSPEGRIAIIDCIEFNDRFRYADPVADIAFLAMELEFEDRPELARVFAEHYQQAAGDSEGWKLLPYYIAYRDIVRGKVRTLAAADPSIARPERQEAAARATRHVLRALGRLAPPGGRPVLMVLGGLPGVGKSVLARALADEEEFIWIDTDRVRKRLVGRAGVVGPAATFEEGIYTPEWTERTYEECLEEVESLLFQGSRVVVEGSFRTERHRRVFLEAARGLGVPALLVLCEADRVTVRGRLRARAREASDGEPSDADWGIYEEMERRWEPVGPVTDGSVRRVRTDRPAEQVLAEVTRILRDMGRAV